MSWTEMFPVLLDEMVTEYLENATDADKCEHDRYFEVERIINPSKAKHIVSFSLFWKNALAEDGDLPPLDEELLKTAQEQGLVKRYAPWEHYVEPVLQAAEHLYRDFNDICIRVYLASDLHFLIEKLIAVGCEIHLMRHSSLRHNPGAMWRFMALEAKGKRITIADADRAMFVHTDIGRTDLTAQSGLGFWRVPVCTDTNSSGLLSYRPILGCQMGACRPLAVTTAMKALIWHTKRGSIPTRLNALGCENQDIYGTNWPDYGFDEWFLLVYVYPRMARFGIISFVPNGSYSHFLPLDIEYCTWANPRSEMIYFGETANCCGPETKAKQSSEVAVASVSPRMSYPLPSALNLIMPVSEHCSANQLTKPILICTWALSGPWNLVAHQEMAKLLFESLLCTQMRGDIVILSEGVNLIVPKELPNVVELQLPAGPRCGSPQEWFVRWRYCVSSSKYDHVLLLAPGGIALRNINHLSEFDGDLAWKSCEGRVCAIFVKAEYFVRLLERWEEKANHPGTDTKFRWTEHQLHEAAKELNLKIGHFEKDVFMLPFDTDQNFCNYREASLLHTGEIDALTSLDFLRRFRPNTEIYSR